nr:hypothetical protein [Tanacetum cinerariifolium]
MVLIPYSNIWSYPKVLSPHNGHGQLANRRYPGVRSDTDANLVELWDTSNNMVICWIMGSCGCYVGDYYTKIKYVWEELANINVLPVIAVVTPEISVFLAALNKQKEEQRLFQFLNGLEDHLQEESQRLLFKSSANIESSALLSNGIVKEKCFICGFKWHPPEKCWEKVGYPSWHAKYKEDIQCASSDTRPPMLDRTDFASWKQCIRLYCRGIEGPPHLGPERPQVYSDLSPEEKDWYNADIRATNILLQGLPKDIYTLINHYTDAKDIWDNNKGQGTNPRGGGAVGFGGVQNRVGNVNPGQSRQVKCYNYNGIGHIARNGTQPKRPQNSDYYKDKMLLMQAQENGVALDKEQLLFLTADDCDAFNSNVDEAPTAQTMFMANLSSADPVNDEAGPSYDSDILSEVHDHDHYQDTVCAHHEEHVMHENVQLNYVVDSHADYTSDSNMIPYDQYVKDNAVPVVHSNVSSVPNDAHMMIYNDMYEPHAQSISTRSPNTVVENSLTAELATYKEQVELYERWARPEPYYNELNKVAIGYKNPLCLTQFDKTCKKRITSIGLTEGERGFEQTKECYLKEVIPFFKTLKENFKGIQKALTIEIKEMKDVFEELEAEVAQCELKAELSNLHDESHNDNHDELVKRFSNLVVLHLNLQLKYQNLKDSFGNNPPTPNKDTPDFDSVFVIGKMQASLQGKDNVIKKLQKKISHSQETRSEAGRTLKVRAVASQITQLTENVTVLQAQNDLFRAENDKIKQHYKELYDSIKITRAKHIEQATALTTANVNLKAQILNTVNSVSKDPVKPKVLVPGKYAIDVEPIIPRLRNDKEAHLDYLRHLKESIETIRDIVEEAKVVRPLDSLIVSACRYTKHS